MADYTLKIVVEGIDQSGPAVAGLDGIGVKSIAVGSLVADAMKAAAGALVGFVGDSVKVAGDFEAGMNTFQAAAGDSLAAAGLSVNDFRDKFLQLGAQLPVSTSAVQEAATTLIKGGLDPMVVKMGGLESSLKFAAAAGMDLNSAAELSIKQLGTFVPITASAADQTKFLADSQNLLVKAAGASTLDVDKLGAAMLGAGGQAKAAGVDYQDFVTTMGAISPSFDSAATAGVSYKNFLARLQPTTKSATAAMSELNLLTADGKSKFYDATGAFVGNKAAAELLKNSLTGLSAAQRMSTLQAIFGNDAMGAAVALANLGADGYDKFAAAMGQASGVEQTAQTVQQGFNIALDNMHGSIEALQIVVGSALLPVLTALFNNVLSPGINTVTQFAQAMLGSADAFGVLPPVLQSVVQWFGDMWTATATLIAALQGSGDAIAQLSQPMQVLMAVLGDVWAAFDQGGGVIVDFINGAADLTDVASVMTRLLGPDLGGAVTSTIGVIDSLYTTFQVLGTAGHELLALFTGFQSDVYDTTDSFREFLSALGFTHADMEAIDSVVHQAAAAFQSWMVTLYQAGAAIYDFATGATGLIGLTTTLAQLFGPTLGGLIAEAVSVLNNYATVWIDLGQTIYNVASALMSGDLSGAWTALTSGLAQVVTDYQTYAASMGALVLNIVNAIITAVVTYAPLIYQQLLTWGQAFVDWISPYVAIALEALTGFLVQVGAWIVGQAPILYQQFITWGQSLVDWVAPYIPIVLETLNTWIAGIWTWIQTQAPIWIAQLSAWGQTLSDWVAPYLPIVLTTLGTWIAGIWAWVQTQAPIFLQQLLAWGQAFVDWIAPAIPPVLAAIGGLASALFAWVGAQVAPLLTAFGAWAQSIIDWIPGATVQFLAAWPGMLGSFLDWIAGAAVPILEKLAVWALSFVQWIAPMIPDFIVALGGIAVAILAFIAETVGVLVAKLIEWGPPFYTWVHEKAIPALMQALAGLAQSIVGWIGSAVGAIAAEAGRIGQGIVDGIQKGIEKQWGRFTSWIKAQMAKIPQPIRDALSMHSPSKVMADLVGIPIVEGIAEGIKAATPKAVAAMSDVATKLLDTVTKGVDAFAKLRQMGSVPDSAINAFVSALTRVVQGFDSAMQSVGTKMLTSAGEFAKGAAGVVDLVAKAVDALGKLANFRAISDATIGAFVDALVSTVSHLVAAVETFDVKALAGAAGFAEGAGKVLAIVGTGVDAFNKLSTLGTAVPGMFLRFATYVRVLVNRMVELSADLDGTALAAAVAFAEGAGKIIAIVGSAVDAFGKLAGMGEAIPGMFLRFALYVRVLVGRMGEAASEIGQDALAEAVRFADGAGKIIAIVATGVAAFDKMATMGEAVPGMFARFALYIRVLVGRMAEAANDLSSGALAAAVQFAEGAGKVVGIIKTSVEAFNALATFVAPTWDSMALFRQALAQWVGAMVQLAEWFTGVSLDGAVVFAEGAGKIIGVIKTGVEGLNALSEFVAPTWDAMALFRQSLAQWVGAMVQLAEWFTGVSLDGAVAFSDAAGKVVGILKAGVDGFTALDDLGPVSEAAIANFATAVNQTMVLLGAAASQFSADAIAQAGKFSEAAGKAVGILKTGTEGLLMLDTFTGVSEAAVKRFADGVRLAVAAMAALAVEFGPEATAAANAFAKAAGESTDFLKKGVEGFIKLADLKDIPAAGLKLFAQGIVAVVQTIGQLSTILTTEALAQAVSVANGTDTVITVIKDALKAFVLLGQTASEIPNYVASFQQAVNTLAGNMQRLIVPPAQNLGAQIALGIAAGITSGTPAIVNAVLAAVNAALLAAQSALGIASPSKVFAELGAQTSAGMAQGAMGGIPEVQQAIGQVSGAAAAAGGRGMQGTTSSSTTTFAPGAIVVNAAPGQSVDAIADAVARKLGQRAALRPV